MRPPKEWGGADTVGLLQGFGKSQLAAHIALQEANKQTQVFNPSNAAGGLFGHRK